MIGDGQNVYEFDKEIDPLGPGATVIYMSIIVKQVYWYISQVSVYRTTGPLV